VEILAFGTVNHCRLQSFAQDPREPPNPRRRKTEVDGSNRDFDLPVGLAKQTLMFRQTDNSDNGLVLAIIGIVILILVVGISVVCCFCFGCCGTKQCSRKELHEEEFTPATRSSAMKHQNSGRATVLSQRSQSSFNNACAVYVRTRQTNSFMTLIPAQVDGQDLC